MSCASSTLLLPSLTPKTLAVCDYKTPSLSFFTLSSSLVKLHAKPISVSPSFLRSARALGSETSSSRFVLKVSVSSDVEQEEEEQEVFSNEGEPSFSPDLKLFVGNLPFGADSAALAGLFERAGNVEMVEVIYDKVTGRSRGFGFVTMSTVEEVEAAAQQFNGYEFEGRPLRVNFGPPPPRKEDSYSRGPRGGASFDDANRVHVGNLAWGVDDLALETLFSEQGKVMEAKVVYDRESGRSRGFGFVTYSSADEVNSAVESLNGADLNGRSIRVSVAASKRR
ncbi:29 kDa ribonucleoprotein A, chloroplastic [Malania oleifera]|uniref:29 kDa ribonucleoprotein A, chloroplastic n=1 Tax=Malania oleifera TaxID=397392 RepID=UPI0025AEB1FD|nr:29 kDa ribonucleoprotein A, chloroplastic [Malania oleifera]